MTAEGEDYYYITLDCQYGSDTQAVHDAFLNVNGYDYTAAFFTNESGVSAAYMGICGDFGFSPNYLPTNFIMDRDGCIRAGQNTVPDPITAWENKIRELLGVNFE